MADITVSSTNWAKIVNTHQGSLKDKNELNTAKNTIIMSKYNEINDLNNELSYIFSQIHRQNNAFSIKANAALYMSLLILIILVLCTLSKILYSFVFRQKYKIQNISKNLNKL
jgi:hypothetical protein